MTPAVEALLREAEGEISLGVASVDLVYRLARELRAALADAERYRWLREHSANQYDHPLVVTQFCTGKKIQYRGPLIGKALDAAIDAAREGK